MVTIEEEEGEEESPTPTVRQTYLLGGG